MSQDLNGCKCECVFFADVCAMFIDECESVGIGILCEADGCAMFFDCIGESAEVGGSGFG